MSTEQIKVALVEDSADERQALVLLINGSPGFSCVAAYANAEEALLGFKGLVPDVLLMDIHLPGMSGIECLRQLRARLPATRIMMLTAFEDHDRIFESLRAGASGYLIKNTPPARLLEAIAELHAGGAPMSSAIARQVVSAFHEPAQTPDPLAVLSEREREILGLLSEGYVYKEIADRLGISLGTVRTHIGRIYQKLHVRSRAEAMLKTIRRPQAPFSLLYRGPEECF